LLLEFFDKNGKKMVKLRSKSPLFNKIKIPSKPKPGDENAIEI
jgi:hypothetical protein